MEECWNKAKILTFLPILHSLWTLVYFSSLIVVYVFSKGCEIWLTIRFVLFAIVLTALPVCRSTKAPFVLDSITAILLIIFVVLLEQLINEPHAFLPYIIVSVVFRVVYTKSFVDNFSICAVITLNSMILENGSSAWYTALNLYVWSYFATACVIVKISKRIWIRIWEHTQAIIILKSKTFQQKKLGNALIRLYFSDDVIMNFNSKNSFIKRMLPGNFDPLQSLIQSRQESCPDNITPLSSESAIPIGNDDKVVQAANAAGILPSFSETLLSPAQLTSLKGDALDL
jgi:hypothetical protein